MILKLITAPTAEPVSVSEAKDYLRVTASDEDVLIGTFIVAARQEAENLLKRSLMSQAWEVILDSFPEEIRLPRPPVTSVTSVKYYDTAGVQQTLSSLLYQTDLDSEPARVVPAYGQSWPTARDILNAVAVRYVAGYTNAAAVPQAIKNWILLAVATMYENRESTGPSGNSERDRKFVDGLLDPYVVEWIW